jgi:hypothetical protein
MDNERSSSTIHRLVAHYGDRLTSENPPRRRCPTLPEHGSKEAEEGGTLIPAPRHPGSSAPLDVGSGSHAQQTSRIMLALWNRPLPQSESDQYVSRFA